MKYLILVLALITVPAYATDALYDKLDKVNYAVNTAATGISGNCLIVALEKQRRLLKENISSEVVAFMPWKAQVKLNQKTGKYEQIGHAVLCVGNKCLDNGDLTDDIFDRDEIKYHGEIMTNYRGKTLSGS